jgi:hypothetical protein
MKTTCLLQAIETKAAAAAAAIATKKILFQRKFKT